MMLSTTEAAAHLQILDVLSLRLAKRITRHWCEHTLAPLLEQFRARCQCCRHFLNVSVWVDGVRLFRCNWCAVSWKECV